MVSIVVESPHRLVVTDTQPTQPGPSEVAIDLRRAGICGSDMHILHGTNPFARYPRIIGHEMSGVVTAVGPKVLTCKPGDHVVVDPVVACGRCYPCKIGRPNVCANLQVFGVHRDGGFRSSMVVPAANAIPVSADLSFARAALAEPLSIAANVLSRTGCGSEDVVLVYGAGTVGITVLQVAKMFGARCIVADPDAARLERARGFGADVTLRSGHDDIPAAVAGELDGLGPSVVIDGAGVPSLLAEMCRVAAPAGRIGLLGFSPEPTPVVQQQVVSKELSLHGSRLNRRLMPQVIAWLETGKLQPDAMVTQTFAAADAKAAFALIESQPEETVKVQLAFD